MIITWFSSPRVSSKYLFFEILSHRSCICVESLRCGSSYASWVKVPYYNNSLQILINQLFPSYASGIQNLSYWTLSYVKLSENKKWSPLGFENFSEKSVRWGRWPVCKDDATRAVHKAGQCAKGSQRQFFPWDENYKNAEFIFLCRKQSKPNKLKRSCSTFSNKLTKNRQFLCRQSSLT